MSYLINFLERILVWLKDLLLWLPRKLYELVLDGLAWIFENLPVPDWLTAAGGLFANVAPEVMFFLAPFAFLEGLAIVISAYIIRFLIRRIPVVG